ncbi:defensin-like protein 37 [Syzygium oleosum]|uniref:defensin-like protein 37 n=1 Tax=Syzygium oleosum TaxID=219896 RepID=UPI0024B8AF12|nr:defensin-like protein 37 [Syzygium oleosum]
MASGRVCLFIGMLCLVSLCCAGNAFPDCNKACIEYKFPMGGACEKVGRVGSIECYCKYT